MNQEQIMGVARAIIPAALAYLVGRGWISEGAVADISTAIVTIGAAIWSAYVHTQHRTIAMVAAMPEVKKVELEPTKAGIELKTAVGSTPSAVVTLAVPPPTTPEDKLGGKTK